MPQGNDTAAHEEFRSSVESQYGPYNNAEELIRAHNANIDAGVRRAGLAQVDPTATDSLREDGIDKVEKKFEGVPDGWVLEDFAVRGNAISGVFVDEYGVYHKKVAPANDRYVDPKLDAEQRSAAQVAERERRVAAETARLHAEADAEIEKERQKQNDRITAELAKIREKADADLAKAQADAEKDTKKSSGSGSSTKKQGGSRASGNRSGGAGASASRAAGGNAAKSGDTGGSDKK